MPVDTHLCGLDLGQLRDPTAFVVLHKGPPAERPVYTIRSLHRWQLGTPYPAIVRDVVHWTSRPPLAGGALAVDWTGVGLAVVDQFRETSLAAALFPILITGGHATAMDEDAGGWHVAKKELVSVLQVLLGSRRLVLGTPPPALGKTLAKELRLFSAKITAAGNEKLEAWRERDHDDLCLAVALAAFLGERTAAGWDGVVRSDAQSGRRTSLLGQMPADAFPGVQQPANDPRFFGGRPPDRGGISWPSSW
jgi:hypothetical protein